ncbi:cupin domain-containing protein [Gorillibacterium timonense]|uniref:cupin domain-containing protein n=1 Tax=Gorillibacterium timonense TaxID=1689269 RepID=UPI00071DAEE2|nr:cupin domain-containing protein [Gorillibacterium timonense]
MTAPLSPLVDLLKLRPHVEGGWFTECWRTHQEIPQSVLGPDYSGARAAATGVHFLLHPGEVSNWHLVLSDELWIWQSGSPIRLTLGGAGELPSEGESILLGMDVAAGQSPVVLVPAGVWQTAKPQGDEPSFVTCIVAPGFEYDDFRLEPKAE